MDAKARLLKEAGYSYNFERMAYINREKKKVFAAETVEDHSEEWLVRKLDEINTADDWKFYDEPSVSVRRIFVAELEDARHTHR
jgi:hypothetical protein